MPIRIWCWQFVRFVRDQIRPYQIATRTRKPLLHKSGSFRYNGMTAEVIADQIVRPANNLEFIVSHGLGRITAESSLICSQMCYTIREPSDKQYFSYRCCAL